MSTRRRNSSSNNKHRRVILLADVCDAGLGWGSSDGIEDYLGFPIRLVLLISWMDYGDMSAPDGDVRVLRAKLLMRVLIESEWVMVAVAAQPTLAGRILRSSV